MNTLLQRSITGLIFISVLIGSISFGSISFGILFLILTILGVWEFFGLCSKANVQPHRYSGTLTAVALFVSTYLYVNRYTDARDFLILIPLVIVSFGAELYRKHESPFGNLAYTVFGVIYIAVPFSLLNFLVHSGIDTVKYTPHVLLGFLFLMWSNDTGAYLTGSKFGKNRLFERISPKKSWEGTIGGGIFTLIIAYLISLFFKELSLIDWEVIAVIVVVAGNYGDLAESLFKRSIDIKDSGTILPGHGGILDRFDSVLLSAPLVFVYLQLFHPYF